jgi:hypothetical protein
MTTFWHTIDYAPVFPAQFSVEQPKTELLPHSPLTIRAWFGARLLAAAALPSSTD